jgi:hypothetical protein
MMGHGGFTNGLDQVGVFTVRQPSHGRSWLDSSFCRGVLASRMNNLPDDVPRWEELYMRGSYGDALAYAAVVWPAFEEVDGLVLLSDEIAVSRDHQRVMRLLEETAGDRAEVERQFNLTEVSLFFARHPDKDEEQQLALLLTETWKASSHGTTHHARSSLKHSRTIGRDGLRSTRRADCSRASCIGNSIADSVSNLRSRAGFEERQVQAIVLELFDDECGAWKIRARA